MSSHSLWRRPASIMGRGLGMLVPVCVIVRLAATEPKSSVQTRRLSASFDSEDAEAQKKNDSMNFYVP